MGGTHPLDVGNASPSALLPPLARAASTDPNELKRVFSRLRSIYNPPIHGFAHDASHGSTSLRDDAFERTHTVKWLTAFIARYSALEDDGEELVREAASILAVCSGSSAQGVVSRVILLGDVEVLLDDAPLDSDASGASVGLQTWGSSSVLAQHLVQNPALCRELFTARILELGAGTGLVTLVLAKLLPDARNRIVSTDCHSGVLGNLRANVARNGLDDRVEVRALDWSAFETGGGEELAALGLFAHIFAADVVYEAEQCGWLSLCVRALLQKPDGIFHLVVPVRRTHARETQLVEAAFPLDGGVSGNTGHRLVAQSKTLYNRMVSMTEESSQDPVRNLYHPGHPGCTVQQEV
ncbi:hypothetical protein AURDEDRAFT_161880 [Auricularia subglabra TFB-10046 SS5]|nr:hypothetical protein AURDEDRAFT_161880 [Auricularia subglabra TFB-10046 SS5]